MEVHYCMDWVLAHLIGDHILQNDYIINNKEHSHKAMAFHVLLYLVPFLFLTDFSWKMLALIGFQHWIQDKTKIAEIFLEKTGRTDYCRMSKVPWTLSLTESIFHLTWIRYIIYVFG